MCLCVCALLCTRFHNDHDDMRASRRRGHRNLRGDRGASPAREGAVCARASTRARGVPNSTRPRVRAGGERPIDCQKRTREPKGRTACLLQLGDATHTTQTRDSATKATLRRNPLGLPPIFFLKKEGGLRNDSSSFICLPFISTIFLASFAAFCLPLLDFPRSRTTALTRCFGKRR